MQSTPGAPRIAPPLLVWHWLPAAVALVAVLPAMTVTAVVDVRSGAAMAVGMIPAVIVGLRPDRRARVMLLAAGVILGVPIVVGSAVAPWAVAAVATMLMLPIVATWAAPSLARPRISTMLIVVAPPLVGVGLSLDGWTAGLAVAALFIGGSVVTFAVAMAVPTRLIGEPPPSAEPPVPPGIGYGVTVGSVGALTAGIGYAFGFDHVGWACAAALLVLRPDPDLQMWRTAGRFVSVIVGAAIGAVMVELGTPDWGMAIGVGAAIVAAAATRGSRWYILPTFTTYLVLLLLTAADPDAAPGRFGERVGETVLGLAVAAVVGLGIPAIRRTIRPGE